MNIQVTGIDPKNERNLQHIANLFYEECSLTTNNLENPDLIINFEINNSRPIIISAQLFDVKTNKQYETQYEKKSESHPGTKGWEKEVRQAIAYAFLTVLQVLTGITQKWGILTGIRPIKLLHNKLNQGVLKEEAHALLKANYMIHQDKINLMQTIVDKQLRAVPDLFSLQNEVSIYIGIPFCPTKCAYCTFPAYAINGRQGSVDSFLGGLHYEIREIGKWLKEQGIPITTIYFGGGTPTSITADEMDMLYEGMYQSFPNMDKVREITVEAGRPDTITIDKLKILKKWNIDRISINPQSYIQETLKAIGRHHTVEETIKKFMLAREMGMTNINMDLIIGLPGEGLEEFEHTLHETAKLMPESLTIHTLSFKRASEMTQNKEKYKVADRDEIQKMMNRASEWTKINGYTPYYLYRQKNILGNLENIGYSLLGHESLYNILIMEEQQTIIGLGCGAASKLVDPKTKKITRFANPKDPKTYNDNYEYYTNKKIKLLSEQFS
ncbi:MAG TPA: coproporphyrinogen III oxidase [Bacillus bacterium]|nr:coproporphyrinogen III oxidase [Bacillus sp. (in: firmicutes)]